MNSESIYEVSNVDMPVLLEKLETISNELVEVSFQLNVLNTTLLYVVGFSAAAVVILILYNFFKTFM